MLTRLLPLGLATFAVGTDRFVIAGLLPSMAIELRVSVATAGQLVTAFAVTFAVSATVGGAASAAMSRRATLMAGLSAF